MKQLLFILILLLSIPFYGQEKKDNITNTQTERIIDKYSDKIINGFNTTIEKVTPMAEEGFAIVVKLKFIKGVIKLIISFICSLIILIPIINKKIRHFIIDETSGVLYMFLLIPLFIFGVTFSEGITYIFVPEWYAIKEIMGLF